MNGKKGEHKSQLANQLCEESYYGRRTYPTPGGKEKETHIKQNHSDSVKSSGDKAAHGRRAGWFNSSADNDWQSSLSCWLLCKDASSALTSIGCTVFLVLIAPLQYPSDHIKILKHNQIDHYNTIFTKTNQDTKLIVFQNQ